MTKVTFGLILTKASVATLGTEDLADLRGSQVGPLGDDEDAIGFDHSRRIDDQRAGESRNGTGAPSGDAQ